MSMSTRAGTSSAKTYWWTPTTTLSCRISVSPGTTWSTRTGRWRWAKRFAVVTRTHHRRSWRVYRTSPTRLTSGPSASCCTQWYTVRYRSTIQHTNGYSKWARPLDWPLPFPATNRLPNLIPNLISPLFEAIAQYDRNRNVCDKWVHGVCLNYGISLVGWNLEPQSVDVKWEALQNHFFFFNLFCLKNLYQ